MTELSPGTILASVTKIFKHSRRMDTHRSLEKTDFSADELDVILDPEKMTKPSDKL